MPGNVDELDEQVDASDQELWEAFRKWLKSNAHSLLYWQFVERLNNDSGVLQFFTSRNHYDPTVDELLHWIAKSGTGSYGIVYVQDDEDDENANEFKVHRVLNGKIDVCDDPFLSPIVPKINPAIYA